jgi:hypothetical protein
MDVSDLIPVAPAGKKRPPRDDAAAAFGSTVLPIAQVCLFVWLGSEGVPALVLLAVLPLLAAVLSYVISGLIGATAERRTKSAVSCLIFSLMWDFPALFLVTVSQTF